MYQNNDKSEYHLNFKFMEGCGEMTSSEFENVSNFDRAKKNYQFVMIVKKNPKHQKPYDVICDQSQVFDKYFLRLFIR